MRLGGQRLLYSSSTSGRTPGIVSPSGAKGVQALMWKLWERAGHQELKKVVYVCVCAGGGLPGLAYARSTLYY